jgi:hypothetical protein
MRKMQIVLHYHLGHIYHTNFSFFDDYGQNLNHYEMKNHYEMNNYFHFELAILEGVLSILNSWKVCYRY